MSPSHVAEACRQVMSPSHVAESCRRVMSPSHVAEACRRVMSPSHVAESCRRVMSPSRVAESCRRVMSPRHVAEACRRHARLNRNDKKSKPESPPGIAAQSSSRKPPLVGYSLFFMATLNPGHGWAMAAYWHAPSPHVLARPLPYAGR